MQTQRISLNVSAMQMVSSGKSAKSDQVFDQYMTQKSSSSSMSNKIQNHTKSASQSGETTMGGDNMRRKISMNSKSNGQTEWKDAVNLEEVEKEVVSFLKETFGMSEEDIVDILQILGISPTDLLFVMSPELQNVSLIHMENIKAFVMEVHGVDDSNLFLISDIMSQELNDVMSGLQDVLEQSMGLDLEQIANGDRTLMKSFAEQMGELLGEMDESARQVSTDNVSEDTSALQTTLQGETPVVVEMTGDDQLSNTYGDHREEAMDHIHHETSPLESFVERLTQSFDEVRQEDVAATRELMTNIVDQVVHHIRIRVLPQTTSMELQLNPESLGRVNLNVTSNNGLATATLTVQNEVAKEALESQLAVLRENLESHGLKVDSVEVNVSEFGFKNPEDSDQGQYQQKKPKNRRFRMDVSETNEEVKSEDQEQIVGNSTVDYTA